MALVASSLSALGKRAPKPLKPQNTPGGYPLGPPAYIYVVIDLNTRGRPPGTPLKSYAAVEL